MSNNYPTCTLILIIQLHLLSTTPILKHKFMLFGIGKTTKVITYVVKDMPCRKTGRILYFPH